MTILMRTTKSYKSRYSIDLWITAAQYIAEIICERVAKHHKLGSLPYEFWKDEIAWGKLYKAQIILASKYLKQYPAEVILAGLNSPNGKKVYSLGAKFILDKVFKDQMKKYIKTKPVVQEKVVIEDIKVDTVIAQPKDISITNNPFKGLD